MKNKHATGDLQQTLEAVRICLYAFFLGALYLIILQRLDPVRAPQGWEFLGLIAAIACVWLAGLRNAWRWWLGLASLLAFGVLILQNP